MESEACPMSHNALGVMEQLLNPNLSLESRQFWRSIAVLPPLHNESQAGSQWLETIPQTSSVAGYISQEEGIVVSLQLSILFTN